MNFFFFFCVMLNSIYSVAKSYILFSHFSFLENNQLQGKVTSNNVHYIFNIVNFTQQHDSILSYRGYISAQPYIFYILLLSQEVCKDPLPCCIFPPQQLWSSSKVYASWAVLQQFVLSKLPPDERVLEAKWQKRNKAWKIFQLNSKEYVHSGKPSRKCSFQVVSPLCIIAIMHHFCSICIFSIMYHFCSSYLHGSEGKLIAIMYHFCLICIFSLYG